LEDSRRIEREEILVLENFREKLSLLRSSSKITGGT
jgi:hypothetical protein